MIKNKYVALVIFIILCIAIWNVAQYLWATLISGEIWAPVAGRDFIKPGVAAACVGYVLFFLGNNRKQ